LLYHARFQNGLKLAPLNLRCSMQKRNESSASKDIFNHSP
jgi:hypothetical protein